MANIERRRKKRIWFAAGAAALALLVLGGIAALTVFFLHRHENDEKDKPLPSAAYETQSAITETATEIPAEAPSQEPVEETASVTAETTEEPVETPASSETAEEDPDDEKSIRISDEQSEYLLEMSASKRFTAAGEAVVDISAGLSVLFANNTDRPLYSAYFRCESIDPGRVLIDGVPANIRMEGDVLCIPFVNELPMHGEIPIYIEFSCTLSVDESLAVPMPDYDTSVLVSAYCTSDITLRFTGCKAQERTEEGKKLYFIDAASVRELGISFVY